MSNRNFQFALGAAVAITVSSEKGVVIGRAEYINAENSYLVRYKAADGRAVESWWNESAASDDAAHQVVAA